MAFVTTQNCSEIQTLRSAAILTTSYVAATVLDTALQNQVIFLISFTKGSLTTAEVKVEFSYDDITYFQETSRLISGSTSADTALEHSYNATGNFVLDLPIMYRYVKISAKGTGTVTNSSMTIYALVGTN